MEGNVIQYYEILDSSDLINTNSLSIGPKLLQTSIATNQQQQQQILYYIQNDSIADETNIIIENQLDHIDEDQSSTDPLGLSLALEEDCDLSEEIFKVITMQDGQVYITETNKVDDIKINTDEDIRRGTKEGYREIDLDGTRAFIEESVWQVFSKKADIDLTLTTKLEQKKKVETKRYYCSVDGCNKFYTSAGNLLVHMRSHTGFKPFICPITSCAKDFATGYSLKTHIRCHSGEKPYPCLVCDKSFKTSGDLSKHLRTHTGERPFPCSKAGCNKRFTTSNIRKVHERSHTGERPYICDFDNCGKSFASATNHKNHLRIHTGEKPYACKIQSCRKRFTEYSSLHKHSMVHLHGCLFNCDICLYPFKSDKLLRRHKRTVHAQLTYSPASIVGYTEGALELHTLLPNLIRDHDNDSEELSANMAADMTVMMVKTEEEEEEGECVLEMDGDDFI